MSARWLILYSQLTFGFVGGENASWFLQGFQSQVIVFQVFQVLFDRLAGVKRLGSPRLPGEQGEALIKFGV